MLEIRNVTKIYHSKNGNSVKALDNISMTFPETGMVFILGKSGSGKSTLLNVIGGLDGYDSGEFIIKGKSSKDFAGSDFDAYRNTFIGFIFQEYNILDDFTVGANIGLALELQGKKATSEVISNILAQVDMLEYAKRKPNELSGGQKQRIAIARALVKDPEIIMADEPTGALDSNTGKQIFDTLKELSKKKLVIIVSHDRDFAEQYGDRIIEMKDGNVLSDVTKHQVEATAISSGILQMNDNLLRIEKGYQLTAKDLELINAYLREQPTEILISGDRRINDGVRNTAGISEDNTSSVFKDTDEAKDIKTKEYDKKNTKFIRSRLPMKNALKMGSSSLGHKKFRLAMTILLSLVAFALFGFADTLGAYDKIVAATDSIVDSNVQNASFSLGVKHTWVYPDGDNHYYYQSAAMNENDIKSISEKTGIDFIPVFNGTAGENWGSKITLTGMMSATDKISSQSAYTGSLYGFASVTADDISSLNFALTGKMPETEDQIVITKLMCDEFNLTGFVNNAYKEKISAGSLQIDAAGGDNSIIGKHFTVSVNGMSHTFEICGVIDTRFDTARYANYIPSENQQQVTNSSDDGSIMDMIMLNELQNTLEYGFHGLGYIKQEKLDKMAENMKMSFGVSSYIGVYMNNWSLTLKMPSDNGTSENTANMSKNAVAVDKYMGDVMIEGSGENHLKNFYRVAQSSDMASLNNIVWFDGRTNNTLGANEMLVHESVFNNISDEFDITQKVNDIIFAKYGKRLDELENKHSLREVLNSLSYEAYVNDDSVYQVIREELKAKYYDTYQVETDDDEELRRFFKEKYDNGEFHMLPESVKTHEVVQKEAYRDFINELFGKEYSEEYDIQFYSLMLDRAISSRGEGSYILNEYNFQQIAAIEYAYATVYGNESFYTSDAFYDAVMASRYGEKKDENYVIEKKNAANAYAYYIFDNTYDETMELFGEKRYSDFESEATAKYYSFAGIDKATLLNGAYLERSTWGKDGEEVKKLTNYRVVGTFGGDDSNLNELVVSDTLYAEYQAYIKEQNMAVEVVAAHESGIYAFVIAPMPTDKATIQKLVEINYDESGDYRFELQNQVIESLGSFNDFIEMGAKIFLYVGIGFAVFAALMLMNFISVSISYKRREIGILRAVGARSSDVFKIFFCEAFIIALINYILSLAAAIAATVLVNNLVRNEGINVTLLHFGARQVILMFVISVVVAALASFLPVWNIARRKPVDAIKNK